MRAAIEHLESSAGMRAYERNRIRWFGALVRLIEDFRRARPGEVKQLGRWLAASKNPVLGAHGSLLLLQSGQ